LIRFVEDASKFNVYALSIGQVVSGIFTFMVLESSLQNYRVGFCSLVRMLGV
jgi:hypothetical protein